MYRLSNNIKYTGKSELSRPYIICTGNMNNQNIVDGWNLVKKMQDGSRVYFSNFLGQLHINKKPLNDNYYDFFCHKIDLYQSKVKHPSIEFGFSNEAFRLFPKINKKTNFEYRKFIDYLNIKYGLEDKVNKENKLYNYIDDFGPFCLVRIGTHKFLIPELPNIYLAPNNWRLLTWYINNSFSGPYPKNTKNIYFSWGDFNINYYLNSDYDKAIAIFLIAKFIIIYEAWVGKPQCEALLRYIELITKDKILPF